MRLQNDFGYIVRSRGDLGGYGNEILFLFNLLVSAKGQIISEQNVGVKKDKGTLVIIYHLICIINCLFFICRILGARARILTIISLPFLEN